MDLPHGYPNDSAAIWAGSSRLAKVAAAMASDGHKVTHIPLFNQTGVGKGGEGLCPCDYHPTHSSYNTMAKAIFNAIDKSP